MAGLCCNKWKGRCGMFYLGGMTLGYLAPPARDTAATKASARKEAVVRRPANGDATEECEREREQEWARAFLAPWHLFY